MIFETLNDGSLPLKILKVLKVRWLSLAPALRRVKDQWVELQLNFQIEASQEKSYVAEMLYNMYKDPKNELYVLFVLPILEEANKVIFSPPNRYFFSCTVGRQTVDMHYIFFSLKINVGNTY